MINENIYINRLNELKLHENKLKIITDINTLKKYERETNKIVGIIDNQPYFNINLDVFYDSNTLFRYCNIEYKKMGAAVLPIIVHSNKEFIIFEKHFRPLTGKIHLEIPRGFADLDDKSVLQTAFRELSEETGLRLKCNTKIIKLGTMYPDTSLTNNQVSLFAVKSYGICEKDLINRDFSENIHGFKIIDFDSSMNLIKNNQINDSFTITSILRYSLMNF